MDSLRTFDLKYEADNAKLDQECIARLVTPSGFKLELHPQAREMSRLTSPDGSFYDFEEYTRIDDDEDESGQFTVTVYLQKEVQMPGVTPKFPQYGVGQFVRDLVTIKAKLGDEIRPTRPPTKVEILDA